MEVFRSLWKEDGVSVPWKSSPRIKNLGEIKQQQPCNTTETFRGLSWKQNARALLDLYIEKKLVNSELVNSDLPTKFLYFSYVIVTEKISSFSKWFVVNFAINQIKY